MNDDRKEPYIRWYVPRWRSGPPKVVEISRRNWLGRVFAVVLMWAIIIAFFGLLIGIEIVPVLIFLAVLIVGGLAFYGWYSGRAGVGKEPAPLIRKKGV